MLTKQEKAECYGQVRECLLGLESLYESNVVVRQNDPRGARGILEAMMAEDGISLRGKVYAADEAQHIDYHQVVDPITIKEVVEANRAKAGFDIRGGTRRSRGASNVNAAKKVVKKAETPAETKPPKKAVKKTAAPKKETDKRLAELVDRIKDQANGRVFRTKENLEYIRKTSLELFPNPMELRPVIGRLLVGSVVSGFTKTGEPALCLVVGMGYARSSTKGKKITEKTVIDEKGRIVRSVRVWGRFVGSGGLVYCKEHYQPTWDLDDISVVAASIDEFKKNVRTAK
jgi:hypothetical protein